MLFDRSGPGADYEDLHFVQDEASGLRAVIAVHSTTRGPAFGGIRRLPYASEEDQVADALQLAEGMSLKCAAVGLDAGGAKTTVLDHAGLRRADAYRALGRAVASMGGRYVCGPDVGTTDADLDEVRAETDRVNPASNDAGAATAAGVMAGIRGVLRHLHGSSDPAGRTFVVQGLGAVGRAAADQLLAAGANVSACDVNDVAVESARDAGIDIVSPEEAITTPCDVFVPCALGGILSAQRAQAMPAKAVCGSANNQLADDDAARILNQRGILYAPDFVVNSGAVIEGFYTIQKGATDAVRAEAAEHIATIEDRVVRMFEMAERESVTPLDAALRMARRGLEPMRV